MQIRIMSSSPEDIHKQILPKIFNLDKDLIRDAGFAVKEFMGLI